MRQARVSTVAALFLGTIITSCTGSAGTSGVDASMSLDLGPMNDLSSSDIDELTVEERFDASQDLPVDAVADVAADHPEVFTLDVPPTDVPGLHVGSAFIPVDPNAVPPPGSECTGDAGVREGDPAIAPPRPVRPLSVSRVTSQRPTFQWVLPEGTTGARVEVCADRCCTRVLQSFDAEGTTARPTTALPPGVVFWRMFGRRGMAVGSRASFTWEFGVRRRDAPNDTSWGTIRDFNGDGYDDLIMFRPRTTSSDRPADLLLASGSAEGLRRPIPTGATAMRLPYGGMIGDFNGDGLADIVWSDRTYELPVHSWFSVVAGARGRMTSNVLRDVSLLGSCARTGLGATADWNGDGYSDLIVSVLFGCDVYSRVEASVLLGYSGSPLGVVTTPQWALRVDGWFSHPMVLSTAGIGDVDNDGYGDIFVMSGFSGAGTTSVPAEQVILHGAANGEPRREPVLQPRPLRGDWASGRPAPAGDVDGDGYIDLLMSLDYSNPVYLYRHADGRVSSSVILSDPLGDPYFGFSFSAGDLNGDGLSDVIISSESAHLVERERLPVDAGRVYVFWGSHEGIVATPFWMERTRFGGEAVTREVFGSESMSPGDVNGDGVDDLVMLDSLGARLCSAFGRLGGPAASPDVCLDDVTISRTLNY